MVQLWVDMCKHWSNFEFASIMQDLPISLQASGYTKSRKINFTRSTFDEVSKCVSHEIQAKTDNEEDDENTKEFVSKAHRMSKLEVK